MPAFREGLSFDDVLLIPKRTQVLPSEVDTSTKISRNITAFLTTVWRSGALFGTTPQEAFFVKCDAENNPADVRDRGQLVIDVGLAPVKPAEFVIFRFSQYTNGGA